MASVLARGRPRLSIGTSDPPLHCIAYLRMPALRQRSPGLDFGHLGEGAAGISCMCGWLLGLSRARMVCAPIAADAAGAGAGRHYRASSLPTAPPALSPDCRTKRIAGDRSVRPLRAHEPGRSRQTQRQGARHRLVLDGRRRRLLAVGHLHRQARDLARRLASGHGLRRGRPWRVG